MYDSVINPIVNIPFVDDIYIDLPPIMVMLGMVHAGGGQVPKSSLLSRQRLEKFSKARHFRFFYSCWILELMDIYGHIEIAKDDFPNFI